MISMNSRLADRFEKPGGQEGAGARNEKNAGARTEKCAEARTVSARSQLVQLDAHAPRFHADSLMIGVDEVDL